MHVHSTWFDCEQIICGCEMTDEIWKWLWNAKIELTLPEVAEKITLLVLTEHFTVKLSLYFSWQKLTFFFYLFEQIIYR